MGVVARCLKPCRSRGLTSRKATYTPLHSVRTITGYAVNDNVAVQSLAVHGAEVTRISGVGPMP